MTDYKFVTHAVKGMEGMVRNLFADRAMTGSAASRIFPGVRNVAILPAEFASEAAASAYLEPLLEEGGNAAAVRTGPDSWLVCAWVRPPG